MHASFLALLRLWALREPGAAGLRDYRVIVLFLTVLSLASWIAIDWWTALPAPQFFVDNTPLFAWYALAVLGLAGLLRWRSRPAPAFGQSLALSMGLVPIILAVAALCAPFLSPAQLLAAAAVAAVYALLYLAKGLRSFTGRTQLGAALGGVTFVVAFVWVTDSLNVIPDVWTPTEIEAASSSTEGLAEAESILFSQAPRIDQALAAFASAASAAPKAFFLGFAGVGEQKVFAQEIQLAARVLGERYAIGTRSLSLINDERDLQSAPLASVAGLKYALRGIGARMNLDRDVLFLAISSHGGEEATIAVSNSQLPLDDLTNESLAAALRESGIKWRVIIISACYAGAFIDSLKNPQSIVIAAAAADRTSFGCSNDRDLTYFGEAFYRDALPGAHSLRSAFDRAKAAIAARERREHVEASKPEGFFGVDIEAKLASIRTSP